MGTPRDIYTQVCYDLLEPGGLQLGILSDSEFIRFLKLTICDFCNSTAILRRIFTQTVFAGVPEYLIPDDILRTDMVFLQGAWLPRSTAGSIANSIRDWRRKLGLPVCFHEDQLSIRTVGLAPSPNYNGSYIPGADEPDPPHGQYDSFSAIVNSVIQTPPEHRGLTIIGPWCPDEVTMDCELDVPEALFCYLIWGVLERIFSADSELADQQRALFCRANYAEGVALFRAITGECDEDRAAS